MFLKVETQNKFSDTDQTGQELLSDKIKDQSKPLQRTFCYVKPIFEPYWINKSRKFNFTAYRSMIKLNAHNIWFKLLRVCFRCDKIFFKVNKH